MFRLAILLFLLVVIAVIAGGVFLATSDLPSPHQRIEKVLPDDRFPK